MRNTDNNTTQQTILKGWYKMRKEKKQQQRVETRGIQGYHACADYSQNYATQGFATEFKCFASDRPTAADGTKKTFGLEIEMESGQTNRDTLAFLVEYGVYPLFPNGLMKQQRDGSLRGNTSTEIITQPMTKAFIRNQYNAFKAMWLFLKQHDTMPGASCGMHTNVSMVCFGKTREAQEKAIMRLHNYFANHYETACALVKRDTRCTGYCGRMRANYLDRRGSHCDMMNYSHMDESNGAARVEIRLVGPQRTFASFRNTLETIFHLVEAAKDGRDFENVRALWRGCNECVMQRLSDLVSLGLMDMDDYNYIKSTSIDSGIKAATSDR